MVKSEKFTLGKWTVEVEKSGVLSIVSKGNSAEWPFIGTLSGASPDSPGNANLITAAPDMYEIIERMTYEIAGQGNVRAETFTEALALLRKARGEA